MPPAVVLHEHVAHQGARQELARSERDLRLGAVGTNNVSSVTLAAGAVAALYDGNDFTGACLTLEASEPHLGARGFNDTASSVRVGERCPADSVLPPGVREGVKLFAHDGFAGTSARFVRDEPNLAATPLGARTASSLQVPRGATVSLYDGPYWTGACLVVRGDVASLVPHGFNDAASSLRLGDTCAAPTDGHERRPVLVFSDVDYSGIVLELHRSVDDLAATHLGALQTSSIVVPDGMRVALYAGAGFTGSCVERAASDASLVDDDFNDRVTSIRVGAGC